MIQFCLFSLNNRNEKIYVLHMLFSSKIQSVNLTSNFSLNSFNFLLCIRQYLLSLHKLFVAPRISWQQNRLKRILLSNLEEFSGSPILRKPFKCFLAVYNWLLLCTKHPLKYFQYKARAPSNILQLLHKTAFSSSQNLRGNIYMKKRVFWSEDVDVLVFCFTHVGR